MKTLNTYINEWKANDDNVLSIKTTQCFIYKANDEQIKIFDHQWPEFHKYKNNIYINNKNITLTGDGFTYNVYKGDVKVEIRDIDEIKNCKSMFYNCLQLISVPLFNTCEVENMVSMFCDCIKLIDVPLFNTSKVKSMGRMFKNCKSLEYVPLFDTSETKMMFEMFDGCISLNKNTIQKWSKLYDFKR